MQQRQTLKNTLLGNLEIFIMMPSAVERFTSSRTDALKSFLYPLLLYPFVLWAFAVANDAHDTAMLALHAIVSWTGMLAFYGIVYSFVYPMRRNNYFWQFIHMANAKCILSFVLLLPIFLTLLANGAVNEFFTQYWVFYILVNVALMAFIATKALRLNWMLGAFVGTLNLFVSDLAGRLIGMGGEYFEKTNLALILGQEISIYI